MMINIFPVTAFAEEEQSLEEIIRPQVEAFAKSIDQKDADGGAQDALITHGMFGGGKKLSVGKNHALTATIVNSELGKEYLTMLCADLIGLEDENTNYSLGRIYYKFGATHEYLYRIYNYDAKAKLIDTSFMCPKDWVKVTPDIKVNKSGKYDKTLEWIVGYVAADVDVEAVDIFENKMIFDVKVVFMDLFDFSAENGSAIKDLLGFIGLLAFTPFEWESKFNFRIEIPIEKPEENEIFGDMDGSGKVDVSDAYFARLVAAKLVEPTPEQFALCDVDRDGKITAIDANLIRKFAAGIIKSLPIN